MLQAEELEEAPAEEEELDLPVGAAAFPDTGDVATVPSGEPNTERFVAMIKGVQARLNVALEILPSNLSAGGPASSGAEPATSGAGGDGDRRYWNAGYYYTQQDLLVIT